MQYVFHNLNFLHLELKSQSLEDLSYRSSIVFINCCSVHIFCFSSFLLLFQRRFDFFSSVKNWGLGSYFMPASVSSNIFLGKFTIFLPYFCKLSINLYTDRINNTKYWPNNDYLKYVNKIGRKGVCWISFWQFFLISKIMCLSSSWFPSINKNVFLNK